MNCADVQDALLEGSVDDHARLEPHLAQCPACRGLAGRIRDQEDLMMAVLDAHAQADTFDAAMAAVPAQRPRWRIGAALALAAAAVATLTLVAVPGGGLDSEPAAPGAGLAVPVDEPVSTEITLGLGRALLLDADGELASLAVVNPSKVAANTAGRPGQFFLLGLEEGRTEVEVRRKDGSLASWWVTVSEDAPFAPPEAEGVVRIQPSEVAVRVGERRRLKTGLPRSVAVTDPQVLSAGFADGVYLDGLEPGLTDVWVGSEEGWQVTIVTVTP